MRGVRKFRPRCIDCGETDKAKFYAHPTSRTGCQSRCKACDNKNRMARNPTRFNGVAFFRAAVQDLASLLPPERWRLMRDDTRKAIRLSEPMKEIEWER